MPVLSDLSGGFGEEQRGLASHRIPSKVCSNLLHLSPARTKLHAEDLQLKAGLVEAVSVEGWALGVGVGSRSSGLRSSSARTFHADASPGARRVRGEQLWELLFVSLHPFYFLQPRQFLLLSRLYVWLNRSFSS